MQVTKKLCQRQDFIELRYPPSTTSSGFFYSPAVLITLDDLNSVQSLGPFTDIFLGPASLPAYSSSDHLNVQPLPLAAMGHIRRGGAAVLCGLVQDPQPTTTPSSP